MIKLKFYLKQCTSKECGITCCKFILSTINKNYTFLLDPYFEENSSLLDLKKYLLKNNLSSKSFYMEKINYNEIKKYSILVIDNNHTRHFVVLEKIYHKYLLIFDPSIGKRLILKSDFEKIFTKYILMVDLNKKRKFKLFKINYFSYYFTFFISFLIDYGIIYFLSYVSSYYNNYLFLILLAVSFLLNFSLKIFIIFTLDKKLNKELIIPFVEKKIDLKNIEKIYKLKINYINIFTRLSYIFFILIFSVFLIQNSFYNIFILPFIFMISIFLNYIFNLNDLKIKEKIMMNEYYYSLNKEISNFRLLNKNSYLYMFNQILSIFLRIIISFLFMIILSTITKIRSISFNLFYFFAFFTLLKNYIYYPKMLKEEIENKFNNIVEYNRLKNKIFK